LYSMITKDIKIIPKKIKSMFDYTKDKGLSFHNPILGYFKSQEALDQAIQDSGIVQKSGGEWSVPMIVCQREDTLRGIWKRGDSFWGVDPKFEDYKKHGSIPKNNPPKQMHL